jgi:hypothetical protein
MVNPPVPLQLRLLRGNPSKRPLRPEPQPEIAADVPDPPPFLSKYAQDEWWRVAGWMVLWSYFLGGKTIERKFCGRSVQLRHGALRETLAVGSAGVDLGLLDVDPAEDGHQLVGGRRVVRGTSCGGLAEPVG